jgi:pimeloyl-ACP methyl ester carboxylesterase
MSTTPYPDEYGPRTGETMIFLHGGNMGGWMWGGQVELLPGRHLLTPDLPGYGQRGSTVWPGLVAAADDTARTIRERAVGGRAHVVGMSLGGHVALHLLQRHPELVRSCSVTGVAAVGLGPAEERAIRLTVPLWHRRWFWNLQSYAFRIPGESRRDFVDYASGPSPLTNQRMFAELAAGSMPQGRIGYDGPFLATAGEREARSVEQAFPALKAALPQTQTWIAPMMHHPWNAEDPELFTRMVTAVADTGRWP